MVEEETRFYTLYTQAGDYKVGVVSVDYEICIRG